MRIIITGGFGFLGQRLGKYFHDRGYSVFLGSRTKRKKPLWLKNGDVFFTDWKNIYSSLSNIKSVNTLIHAAGMNAGDSEKNQEKANLINGLLSNELLDACVKNKINNFLYLSTAHVYANPLQGEISEDSNLKNNHPYAQSNALGEKQVFQFKDSNKINSKVLRISNCFGAPVDMKTDCWHLLVNNICLQAFKNQKIILKSDGSTLRDFISISEFCRIVDFINKNCMEDKEYNVLNVGGETFSVNEITKLVKTIYEKKYKTTIEIKKNNSAQRSEIPKLNYKMNWTKKYNLIKKSNPYKEIEEILNFLEENKDRYG